MMLGVVVKISYWYIVTRTVGEVVISGLMLRNKEERTTGDFCLAIKPLCQGIFEFQLITILIDIVREIAREQFCR